MVIELLLLKIFLELTYMIKRFKNLSKQFKNLVFIKSIKKDQINEIDFPIIGNQTLELLINLILRLFVF